MAPNTQPDLGRFITQYQTPVVTSQLTHRLLKTLVWFVCGLVILDWRLPYLNPEYYFWLLVLLLAGCIVVLVVTVGMVGVLLIRTLFWRRLEIYARGLRLVTPRGAQCWYWSTITGLRIYPTSQYRYTYGITSYGYGLYIRNREVLRLGQRFTDTHGLGRTLINELNILWRDKYVDDYYDGRLLNFGIVKLTNQRIRTGFQLYQWSEIDYWDVDSEGIMFFIRGKKVKVPLPLLMNVNILRHILREHSPVPVRTLDDLGTFLNSFRAHNRRIKIQLALLLPFVVFWGIVVTQDTPSVGVLFRNPVLFGMLAAVAATPVFLLWSLYRSLTRRIEMYENGIRIMRRNKVIKSYQWEDFDQMRVRGKRRTATLSLYSNGRRALNFDNHHYRDFNEMARILARVFRPGEPPAPHPPEKTR